MDAMRFIKAKNQTRRWRNSTGGGEWDRSFKWLGTFESIST